jgi:hypothetical protein
MHYYGPARRKKSSLYPVGTCKDCGANLVDWTRIHKRSPQDTEYTIEMLRTECWRHSWWHKDLDKHADNYAKNKGRNKLRERAKEILVSKIGSPNPPFEGRQTSTTKNPIFYAQHATGTCCRECLSYWHDIPKDQTVTEPQLYYLTDLVMRYIDIRLPNLSLLPEKQPPIRRPKKEN